MRRRAIYRSLKRGWDWLKSPVLKLLRKLRPLTILCAVAFAVCTVARSAEIPAKYWWEKGHPAPWVLVGTGLVTAVRQTVIAVDRRRRRREKVLSEACRSIANIISHVCPAIPLHKVAVKAWILVGPTFDPHFEIASRFSLVDRQGASVVWTPDKGVFGYCFRARAPVIVDLQAQIYDRATTEDEFLALPIHHRLGLGWDEVNRTREYKTVYAAPLWRRSATDAELRGIISIDVLEAGHTEDLQHGMEGNDDFNTLLGICEAAI
jgi:hypothetical protein